MLCADDVFACRTDRTALFVRCFQFGVPLVAFAIPALRDVRALPLPALLFVSGALTIAIEHTTEGVALLCFGSATISLYAGLQWWRESRWRLEHHSALALGVGLFCVLVGQMAAGDVGYLTATIVPFIIRTLEDNRALNDAKAQIATALDWPLREYYSACSDSPAAFDFVTDVAGELCGFTNRRDAALTSRRRVSVAWLLYALIAIIYMVVATPGVALANVLFLALTDNVKWRPVEAMTRAALARLFLGITGDDWILGHSLALVVYAFRLIDDDQGTTMTMGTACRILFGGATDEKAEKKTNTLAVILAFEASLLTVAA